MCNILSKLKLSHILQENTFQAVVVTDGMVSYALFNYLCGSLQWGSGLDQPSAVSGYNFGGRFERDRLSGFAQITSIACRNSPCSDYYTVLYNIGEVSTETQAALADCLRVAAEDQQEFVPPVNLTIVCPCTMTQASIDSQYLR